MMQALSDWRTQFLAARDVSKPDGRSLFEYQISAAEYEKLQGVLRIVHDFFLKKSDKPLSAAMQFHFFPEYFVLYAAEWWRRNYDGTGFSWVPLLASLGAAESAWSPSERTECVTKGLAAWKVPLNDTYGMRFIGSIAVQAGLPEKLLAKSSGKIASILRRILRLALDQHYVDLNGAVREWVESLAYDLPQTYRKPTVYILLARVITTVLDLKREADLTTAATAIQTLDQRIPQWRDRFPLPVNDDAFRDLLASLMREAAFFKPVDREKQDFFILRELRPSPDGAWDLISSCQFSQNPIVIPERVIPEIDRSKLSPVMDMTIVAGKVPHAIPMRKMANQGYRATSIPWEWDGADAATEHVVRFASPGGQSWSATAPQGDALQDALPWIFSCRESQCDFLGQRGGAFVDQEVFAAIPEEWRMDAETASDAGTLRGFGRKIIRLAGPGKLTSPDAVFRLKTASAESDEQYEWAGKRLWDIAVRPPLMFVGEPTLYASRNGVRQDKIPGRNIHFRHPGQEFSQGGGSTGIVDAVYKKTDETIFAAKLCLLPNEARITLLPESASEGFIILENWGLAVATSKTPGVETTITCSVDGALRLMCRARNSRAPEWVELDLLWASSTAKARIRLPFPAKGSRLFSSDGNEIASGSLLCSSLLHGLRLQAIKGTKIHSNMAMEWLGVQGKIEPIDFGDSATRSEIRLIDHKNTVARLFAMEESLDAQIRLNILQDSQHCASWKFARYNADMEKGCDEVILRLEHKQKLSLEELTAIKVMALPLSATGSEPEKLPPIKSEGAHTGIWFFNPPSREPGLWIIYPPDDGASFFRPTCWPIEGEVPAHDRLTQAILIQGRMERQEEFAVLVKDLASDYCLSEWQTVDWLAMHLSHLPLVALDVWAAFSRNPAGMAALLFRYSGTVKFDRFLSRYSEEFPFMWETISLAQWHRAMTLLQDQVAREFSDTGALASFWLKKRIDDLCSSAQALEWPLQYLLSEVLDADSEGLQQLRSLPEAACAAILADRRQDLLRRRDGVTWPEEFARSAAAVRARPEYRSFLLDPDIEFQDGVLNTPIMLAINVLRGDTARYAKKDILLALRKLYHFDSIWFEEAFSWTFARCLGSGQTGDLSHE
jgi:hypothetical protein